MEPSQSPTFDTQAEDNPAALQLPEATEPMQPAAIAAGTQPVATPSSASESMTTATTSPSVHALATTMMTLAAATASTKTEDVVMEPVKTDSIVSNPKLATPHSEAPEAGAPAQTSSAAAAAQPQPQSSTAAASSPAEPSRSSSESADSARVAELLLYYRELSDHVVREDTAGWDHAGYGGVLMTEWQPESRRFVRPFSLVWLHDDRASAARNDDQVLPSHLKSLPLLPHWTFGVEGDGDCLMRALVLGDVAGVTQQAPLYKPIWDVMLELPRDPLWGKVQSTSKAAEDKALASYRQAYVTLHICNAAPPASRTRSALTNVRSCLIIPVCLFSAVLPVLP